MVICSFRPSIQHRVQHLCGRCCLAPLALLGAAVTVRLCCSRCVAPWKGVCCVWRWLGYLRIERVFSSAIIRVAERHKCYSTWWFVSHLLWAVRLISQKGSGGLHLPFLPAWLRRSKRINQETFQHLPPVFTEITIHYKCLCIFYSTLKSQCS